MNKADDLCTECNEAEAKIYSIDGSKKCYDCAGVKEKDMPVLEKVNHPSHYNEGEYEVIDIIYYWKLNFNLGNAVKYIARADHKGKKRKDLFKAIWYLQREINGEIK